MLNYKPLFTRTAKFNASVYAMPPVHELIVPSRMDEKASNDTISSRHDKVLPGLVVHVCSGKDLRLKGLKV